MLLSICLRAVVLSLMVVLSLINRTPAQCRSCGGGSPAIVNWGISPVATGYQWRFRADGDWELLSGSGGWVGYYRAVDGLYFPWTNFGYAAPSTCPVTLPEAVTRWQHSGAVGWQTTGVTAGAVSSAERTTVVGVERARCAQAPIGPDRLPDISGQFRITPIGTPEECAAIEADWKTSPSLAPFKPLALLKSYRADDPQVTDRGFVTTGRPTISVQAPDGTELRRFDSYPGAETFASFLAGDLRRPNPNYNPAATPGTTGSAIGGLSTEALVGILALALVGGLVVYFHRASTSDDAAFEGVTA